MATFLKRIARFLRILIYCEFANFVFWNVLLMWSAISFHERLEGIILAALHVVVVGNVLSALEFILAKQQTKIHRLSSGIWFFISTTVIMTDVYSLIESVFRLREDRAAHLATGFSTTVVIFWSLLSFWTLIYVISLGIIHWRTPELLEYRRTKTEQQQQKPFQRQTTTTTTYREQGNQFDILGLNIPIVNVDEWKIQ